MEIRKYIINEGTTILEAMKILNDSSKKILFVAEDENLRLLGTLTDGDIRRWILGGGDLAASVKGAANYSPLYKSINDSRENIRWYMLQNRIEALPLLNNEKQIKKIVFLNDDNYGTYWKDKITLPIVIMAGGLGTRLYPYTNILPKPLIPIGETPIVEHIINGFYEQGCEDFYLIVNYKKNMIKAYFGEVKRSYQIDYVDEDKPLGTGGGLIFLKGKIQSTFILTNCDILIHEDFSKIYKYHKEQKNIITMICCLKSFSIPYGVVELGEKGNIISLKEKPEVSFYTNTGCYIVEPEVMDHLAEGETVSFPDIILRCKKAGKKVGVFPIGENAWLDMGQFDEMENMKKRMNLE